MMTVPLSPLPIQVEGLTAAYGKTQILHGLDFSVEAGEVFGLVGLNGTGKTTLIRALLGLGEAKGSISLFGKPHSDPAARAGLIYLPEKYQPSPQLTGWEHLALAQSWIGGALDREQITALCTALAFDPAALSRRVRTYSKGMGQKLGLVAALISALPLLVLDEPMSGLDPRSRVRLKDQLLAVRREGRSIFFSSHILSDIEEICDRIGVLHQGRLIYVGPPRAFIDHHQAPSLERAFLAAIESVEAAA